MHTEKVGAKQLRANPADCNPQVADRDARIEILTDLIRGFRTENDYLTNCVELLELKNQQLTDVLRGYGSYLDNKKED